MARVYPHSFAILGTALLLAWGAAAVRAGSTETEFGDPADPMIVAWAGREIRVWVQPRANEGYQHMARRVMADPSRYAEIERYYGGRPVTLGRPVSFPLPLVKAAIRAAALQAMYPGDYPADGGWVHRVAFPTENLITLAEAFTGSRGKFAEIAKRNKLTNPDLLRIGTEILVPFEWLSEDLELRPVTVKAPLVLEKDARTKRRFVRYTLRKDETLYSSVILRFTDREFADEVNRLARELVKLNGLRDVLHVPAGVSLRIPLEWISDDYVNARPGWRAEVPELEQPEPEDPELLAPPPPIVRAPPAPPGQPLPKPLPLPLPLPKARAVPGALHVIIDPGHGGVDPGAIYGSRNAGDRTYEDEIVYDVALRLAERLRRHGHLAYLTLADPDQPKPLPLTRFLHDSDEFVQVTPAYPIQDVDVGVNMRVYYVESLYRDLTGRQGVDPSRIVFLSIHGDALAASLRGAMAYYPDPELRHNEFRPNGRVYRVRKEALHALIRFLPRANENAADLSKTFAEAIVSGLKGQGIGVGRKPVRSYHYREGRRTLPAVLRYSRVPTSALIEVANLNNAQDRQLIAQPGTREKIAAGLATAVEAMARKPSALTARAALR